MARQVVDIGIQGNDGTGDSIRESFRKVNENFTQLFAVFGVGDRIAFTDLDDAPSSYNEDQLIVSNATGDALVAKGLVGGDGITVDHSAEDQIVIISTGGKVSYDTNPSLSGHLSGGGSYTLGRVAEPNDITATEFNIQHNLNGTEFKITSDDLVIPKGYADRRYVQTSGNSYGGNKLRVRDEPSNLDEYTLTVEWIDGYANVPDHGFNTGLNGIPYIYQTDGVPATNITEGVTYYLRYNDVDNLSLHVTAEDAANGVDRILVNEPAAATGNQYLLDAAYDSTLSGKWLSNEALPRKSIVRRQGDTMTGSLMLYDHPGSLAGQGSPNGIDDLQAATKYYVDNSSFASEANIFVATSGDDQQTNTPPGKEGRAFAYAFASVNAACVKAEELIDNSKKEPGPYRQKLTFNDGTNDASLFSTSGSGATRTIKVYTNGQGVDQSKDINNRDLREGNIIKGLRSGATGIVKSYQGISGLYDEYIVELLHKTTDEVYFQSDYVNASERLLANKELIQEEVIEYVYVNSPPPGFNATKCRRDVGYIVDAIAHDVKFGGNIQSIKAARSYWRGTQSVLPSGEQSTATIDAINYIDFLIQDIIANDVIPTVGLIYKRRSDILEFPQDVSGDVGESGSISLVQRFISTIADIVENGVDPSPGTLLDFLINEDLEFGQPVPDLQITVVIESGIYYEQLPIRVPTNVSLRGDELRRVIVRPAPGISTSKWANLYFYRDSVFDGIVKNFDVTGGTSSGTTITVTDTTGLESGMTVLVTSGTGEFAGATKIVNVTDAVTFTVDKLPVVALSGASIRALDPTGIAPTDGEFGYHYLTDSTNGVISDDNPPKENKDMDMFLLNDGTLIRYLTAQMHGGFMCVLDPEGQILTKSPYIQTCTSLSGSVNKKSFRGGMFIDGASGNLTGRIITRVSKNEIVVGELFNRAPLVPNSFYINGIRYQINEVRNYNKTLGTATLIIDDKTSASAGIGLKATLATGTGVVSLTFGSTAGLTVGDNMIKTGGVGAFNATAVILSVDTATQFTMSTNHTTSGAITFNRAAASLGFPSSVSLPYDITVQTAGNRSMLSNDYTQINDLGYGLVATNNAVTEAVSVFTYYNQISYYALNGGQIRTVAGSSCNGEFGLKAEGRDPNEVPDGINLVDETTQTIKLYKRSSYSSSGQVGDIILYADFYRYIPFNVSELEIDHSNTKSSIIPNEDTLNNNVTINVGGTGYLVGDLLTEDTITNLAEIFPGSNPTTLRVTEIDNGTTGGPGAVTDVEVIDSGTYKKNPVGGYPTITGNFFTTTDSIAGTGCKITGTFLGSIERYQVNSVEKLGILGSGVGTGGVATTPFVIRLNLASSGGFAALKAPIEDGQIVNIRALRNLRFTGVEDTSPSKASTAIQFGGVEDYTTYNSIAYDTTFGTGGSLPPTQAIITFDRSFDYAFLTVEAQSIADTDYVDGGLKTMGATIGDTRIAIRSIPVTDVTIGRINSGDMIITWAGRLHTVVGYTAADTGTGASAYIEISDTAYGSGTIVNSATPGILVPFSLVRNTTIRCGLPAGYDADISKNISTCRATGHDFLDIGSGGYNNTNYPNNVFGSAIQTPSQAREVIEVSPGRVFYVSTDQNGIFRVGPYFSVDQGTGTVSFAASIALTDLDGLGFKRGATIKEFSRDDFMNDDSDTAVPTEQATRGYIDRRLGLSHEGLVVPSGDRIGPGYLPLDGSVELSGDLDLGGYRVINLQTNISAPGDAANVGYVDAQVESKDSFFKLKDVLGKDGYNAGDIVAYSGAGQSLISAAVGGDLTSNFIIGGTTAVLVGTYDIGTGITTPGISGSGVDIDSIEVDDITGFFAPSGGQLGYVQINDEIFTYSSITIISNRLDGIVRAKGASTAAEHTAGDSVINLNGAAIDLSINDGVIENIHVSDTAAIVQSKLSLTIATGSATAPTGTAAEKQAASGLSSFDTANFDITDGWVSVKQGGITLTDIETIAAGTILANLTASVGHPSAVETTTLVSNGLDTLFSSEINNSSEVMVRRDNGLAVAAVFSSIGGTAINFPVTKTNVPVNSISGSGRSALVNVSKIGSGTNYATVTTIIVSFGGNGYAVNDILEVKGSYLDGVDGVNDLQFTITAASGNIDTVSYYDTITASKQALANSIVQADASRNIGSASFNFNAVYASTFYGNLNGSASNVNLTATNDSTADQYLTFSTVASGNQLLRTDTGLKYVPDTGILTAVGFDGDLDGNATSADVADTVTLTATNSASGDHFILFADASSGDEAVRTDTNLTYVPSSNTLTASVFSGSLTGNADTATSATTATNLAGTSVNSIPYQSASQSTSYIPAGDAGQVLISGGASAAPTWSDALGTYRIADDNFSIDIIQVQRTSNVAIVTTSTAHGLSAGAVISVTCTNDPTFNANFVILLSGSNGSTLRYANGGTDVTATSVSGIASTSTDESRVAKISVAGPDLNGDEATTAGYDPYTIVARDQFGNLRGNFFEGTAFRALFADLAEWYSSDKEYEPGTVVIFGGDAEITTTNIFGDARVAGVVSTNPAYMMNTGLAGLRACIALVGRVPVKIVGRVKKGDMITTSAIPGFAAKAIDPKIGTIIGKALQDKDTSESGIIEVVVGRI
jgi:hypothetical protein